MDQKLIAYTKTNKNYVNIIQKKVLNKTVDYNKKR